MTDRPLEQRLFDALSALLADPDVDWVRCRGGPLRVSRRGRREELGADIDDETLALLADRCADGPVDVLLPGDHVVTVARSVEGEAHFYVPGAPRPRSMLELVESGSVSPAQATMLMESLLAGRPIVVGGPHRAGRRMLWATLRTEALQRAEGADVDAPPAGARDGRFAEDRVQAATTAVALGAELLFARGVSSRDVARLLRVPAAWVIQAEAADEGALGVDNQVLFVSCGFGPEGGLEVHVPVAPPAAPAGVAQAPASPARPAPAPRAPVPSSLSPPAPAPEPDPELPPLVALPEGPPQGWATDDDTAGPGWELSDAPIDVPVDPSATSEGGKSFANALAEVKERPTFVPKPPAAHPQTRELREKSVRDEDDDGPDPFGGLTFEPPPGQEGEGA